MSQGYNPFGNPFGGSGSYQSGNQFCDKQLDEPILIVESATTPTSVPPTGVGLITDECAPVLRFFDSPTIKFQAFGANPALVTANAIIPPVIFPPPLPPPAIVAGPADFVRLLRTAELTIAVGVGTVVVPIPFDILEETNDPTAFALAGGGVQVTEAGTYDLVARLPVPALLGILEMSELHVLVNGVDIGIADVVNIPVGAATVITHILAVPVELPAGAIVTVQLVIDGLIVTTLILPGLQGYLTLTRTQNVTVNGI